MGRIRRITWILCAIYVALVLVFSVYKNVTTTDDASYTVTSDSINFSGYTYVSDNSNGFGAIYKLTPDGATDRVYVNHRRKYVADWKVVKLATSSSSEQVGGEFYAIMRGNTNSENYVPYRIVSFTSDMVTSAMSTSFYLHSGLTVTGLSYSEQVFYITGISKTRQDVYIYQYNEGELIQFEGIKTDDKNKLASISTELTEATKERNPSGLLYADAEFADGNLYTRLDGQEADEYFAEDIAVKNLFDNRTESFFTSLKAMGTSLFDIIGICLLGCAIIIVVFALLAHRRWVVYRIVVIEGIIFALCVLILGISTVENHRASVREFTRNETYTLSLLGDNAPSNFGTSDFYASSDYATFYSNLNSIVDRSDAMAVIRDIAVVDSSSAKIAMSTLGYGGDSVDYVYGDDARALVVSADKMGDAVGKLDGDETRFIAVNLSAAPQYKFLCVVKLLSPWDYIMTYEWQLPIIVFVFFLFASFVAISIIIAESAAIRRIGEALEQLGEGAEEVEIPDGAYGYDIKRMWSSINQIEKNLRRASREIFMTYEAYFRFAPKQIEKLLGRDTITEVNIGDTKKIRGTVAVIKAGDGGILDAESANSHNGFFDLAEKCNKSTGGIFISAEDNLSVMRVFFPDDNRSSVRFGTDLTRDAASDVRIPDPMVILHYDTYDYGVAGTESQALTFLSSEDMSKLGDYAAWLKKLGVSMVITETVKERESGAWDLRYIGFIIPNPEDHDRRINFYEVLDAADGETRRGKKKTMDAFKSALDLFYEKDFYFARNAFTDIVREVPTDMVSKWYLFECERLLNEQASPDFVGELLID